MILVPFVTDTKGKDLFTIAAVQGFHTVEHFSTTMCLDTNQFEFDFGEICLAGLL